MVEILIVFAVAAILSAIAYATYTNVVRSTSEDKAKANLISVATYEEQEYRGMQAYTQDTAKLDNMDMGMTFVNTASPNDHTISVNVGTDGNLGLAILIERTGRCVTLTQGAPGPSMTTILDAYDASTRTCSGGMALS
jgi:Tfp pilus assembly protein PilE